MRLAPLRLQRSSHPLADSKSVLPALLRRTSEDAIAGSHQASDEFADSF